MPRKRRVRKRRGRCFTSASSVDANKARWSQDRADRDAAQAERMRELAEYDVWNYPRKEGDALGCLQWTDFRTGKVRRWTIRIGDRIDRITAEKDGKKTKSSGWAWILDHLRPYLCGRKQ